MTPDALDAAWQAGRVVPLAGAQEWPLLLRALGAGGVALLEERWGAGVVVGSGGSSGGRRWCLQPLAHLQASAAATAQWLEAIGLDPSACLHFNPLPLHHVSGLLPWVRARQWGAAHRSLPPVVLRHPQRLTELPAAPPAASLLLSLVPTQLARLLTHPAGVAWLQRIAVIWIGGAPLPAELAERARGLGLRLAPCYGATETAAMVAALPPERFLAGDPGCGHPLKDVELQVAADTGALKVRCSRLSPGVLEQGRLRPLSLSHGGWWRSGDAARLTPAGLTLHGRLDGAIHSGGETVFPEQLEERLRDEADARGWPLQHVLLLGVADPLWGERLVALVRSLPGADGARLRADLESLTAGWAPAERPRVWIACGTLAPSPLGKWQRSRWQRWLAALEAGHHPCEEAPADGHPE